MRWYELHITVEEQPSLSQVIDFDRYCREELNVKCNLIELSEGSKFPMQLMSASRKQLKDDASALQWGEDCSKFLASDWNVVRVKVEAELGKGDNAYFEAHWKVTLISQEDLLRYNHVIEIHNQLPDPDEGKEVPIPLLSSRNLLHDGVYYLSQRNWNGDYRAAQKQFDQADEHIRMIFPSEEVHHERVLFDSNPGLDEGWNG